MGSGVGVWDGDGRMGEGKGRGVRKSEGQTKKR